MSLTLQRIYKGDRLIREAGGEAVDDTLSQWLRGEITELVTDESVTSLASYEWYRDDRLSSLSLPQVATAATGWGQESQLVSVTAPLLTALADWSLYQTTQLKQLSAPLVEVVGLNALRESGLESISLPLLRELGANAMRGCVLLVSVTAPLLQVLGSSAFLGCVLLTDLELPSVTTLDSLCLRDTNLTNLTIGTTNATMSNANALQNTPIAQGLGTIWVPDEAVDAYRAAPNWSTYAAVIQPVSTKP